MVVPLGALLRTEGRMIKMQRNQLTNQAALRTRREADIAAWLGARPRLPERYVPEADDLPARKPSKSLVWDRSNIR
jgi:hypothetical protein